MKIVYFERVPLDDTLSFYFKIISESNEYEERIEIQGNDIINWNCTCKFMIYNGFKCKCKHLDKCINLLNYLEYIKNESK